MEFVVILCVGFKGKSQGSRVATRSVSRAKSVKTLLTIVACPISGDKHKGVTKMRLEMIYVLSKSSTPLSFILTPDLTCGKGLLWSLKASMIDFTMISLYINGNLLMAVLMPKELNSESGAPDVFMYLRDDFLTKRPTDDSQVVKLNVSHHRAFIKGIYQLAMIRGTKQSSKKKAKVEVKKDGEENDGVVVAA
ncbi:hypothetical protein ACFE04_005012 [Oxalis oulophora]